MLPTYIVRVFPSELKYQVVFVSVYYYNTPYNFQSYLQVMFHNNVPFYDSPKSLHRPVINTLCNSGHTLSHACRFQFIVEVSICILKSSVAMTQWMCIWIANDGIIKSIKDQSIIIVILNHIGHNTSVI